MNNCRTVLRACMTACYSIVIAVLACSNFGAGASLMTGLRPDSLGVTENVTYKVHITNTLANKHGDPQASGLLGPVILKPKHSLEVELKE